VGRAMTQAVSSPVCLSIRQSVPLWCLVDTASMGRDLLQLLLVIPLVQHTYPLTRH